MKVRLLQIDGVLPNIALMRIAAHHRSLGDAVEFRRAPHINSVATEDIDRASRPDRVYASLIFERSRPVAEALLVSRPDAVIGGTGWNIAASLEQHGITTKTQDYSIYPKFKPSIGFTQRGCRLKCEFCVVPRKEGKNREEQTIAQLWRGDGHAKHLLLLDNDFFGQPSWRDRVAEIRNGGFKVCFSQGINARLLSEEAAEAIGGIEYRDDSFKVRRIYTAWDSKSDEAVLFRGLERLVRAGVKPDHVMVYVLVGYWPGETHEDREYRRRKLVDFGARPYPMPFVRTRELLGFQRWVIGGYHKSVSWDVWSGARFRPERLMVSAHHKAQTSLALPVIGGAP